MLTYPPVSVRCANCNFQMGVKAPTKLITQLRCPECKHVTPVKARPPVETSPNPVAPAPIHSAPQAPAYPPTQVLVDYGQLEVLGDNATPSQFFKLVFGRQTIGKSGPASATADISIQTTNPYLSRFHCTLEVRRLKNGQLGYLLSDGVDLPDGTHKPSTNGTYLGEARTNHVPPPRLKDTDVVYITTGSILHLGLDQIKLVLHIAQTASKAADDTIINE